MIYLSDDYLTKYIDVLGYLFSRSISEGHSFPYIEKRISYSEMVEELERSDITTIAFSSMEKIYRNIFPEFDNNNFIYNPYDEFGWASYIYIHLFIKYQITFEVLFMIIPLKKMLSLYKIYHEMDINQMYSFFQESIEFSYFDNIVKYRKISSKQLSLKSGVSFSTIASLRFSKRDISKLEAMKLYNLATVLKIKISSLLPNLELKLQY